MATTYLRRQTEFSGGFTLSEYSHHDSLHIFFKIKNFFYSIASYRILISQTSTEITKFIFHFLSFEWMR